MVEIGDRLGEASCFGNLATVFQSLGEYVKARDYLEKALMINVEIGNRKEEATNYGNMGTVFRSLGEYRKAEEYHMKALAIKKEIGDRQGEASCYGNLVTVYFSTCEYIKAKEFAEKSLSIRVEIGDRQGEAADYGNLGAVFLSLGEYVKAEKKILKALEIRQEIGDSPGEASDYGNLANVFLCRGEYLKANESLEKALTIRKEIGDREGEARDYTNLGAVFQSLGEHDKAIKFHGQAHAITRQIGNRELEATSYGNLGAVFEALGKHAEAVEYLKKAVSIRIEIGDKRGEAADYGNLGTVFKSLGEYGKAEEYHTKALAIKKEIGDRQGEAACYRNLATVFTSRRDYVKAEQCLEKALFISRDIGDSEEEVNTLYNFALLKFSERKIGEAFSYLLSSVQKCEDLRSLLEDNDQFKIYFTDEYGATYKWLFRMLFDAGCPIKALYVVELERARALVDLMSAQYCVEKPISGLNPKSWYGIEKVMERESNSTCLYISYHNHSMYLWILETGGIIHPLRRTVAESVFREGFDEYFAKNFRTFGMLPERNCENRSLNDIQLNPNSSEECILLRQRLVEEDESLESEPCLSFCYKMMIAPTVELLKEREIIIVPDRSLYKVPFAALTDESGKYLSETFRIRVVPSLTTLKLILDSPEDYHSQTGALIVGDPEVGQVFYKGVYTNVSQLPCARKEAEMIGRLLSVQPLLAENATKHAILERIHSASLIHFAAHGNAERGEIALSPVRPTNKTPQEEDYLLTMSEISSTQLRAKLVVLSCCHSGQGQVRAEGVVGIARAFLGSGARSVLVALWAIEDIATEQFMNCFYEHLIRGESASESLHQAMKWMRANGYSDVTQ